MAMADHLAGRWNIFCQMIEHTNTYIPYVFYRYRITRTRVYTWFHLARSQRLGLLMASRCAGSTSLHLNVERARRARFERALVITIRTEEEVAWCIFGSAHLLVASTAVRSSASNWSGVHWTEHINRVALHRVSFGTLHVIGEWDYLWFGIIVRSRISELCSFGRNN